MRVSAAKMVIFCRIKSLGYQKRQRLASNYDTRESVARTIRNNQGMLAEAGKLMSGCQRPEGVNIVVAASRNHKPLSSC
jgi:hypothetical protein